MAFVVGTSFNSFADFERKFSDHEKAVFSNFTKQTSRKLVTDNRKGTSFADVEKFIVHRIYLRCKKGGTPQAKDSVKNIRTTSSYRSQCPAKIIIASNHVDKKLFVQTSSSEHNHVCSAKIFGAMPKQRRLNGELKNYI